MVHEFQIPKYYTLRVDDVTGEITITSNSKHAKGRKLSQYFNPNGYLRVKLNNQNRQIHSIIAECFLGERPHGYSVNHKDGNKLNNRSGNLEYVTIAENTRHSVKHGMHICNRPELMPSYKDGRCKDLKAYKKSWYEANKDRILLKVKQRYNAKKQLTD